MNYILNLIFIIFFLFSSNQVKQRWFPYWGWRKVANSWDNRSKKPSSKLYILYCTSYLTLTQLSTIDADLCWVEQTIFRFIFNLNKTIYLGALILLLMLTWKNYFLIFICLICYALFRSTKSKHIPFKTF